MQSNAQSDVYRVSKGDTLYSIAWAFGLDYRSLAQANHLQAPYSLKAGQPLVMTAVARGAVTVPPASSTTSSQPARVQKNAVAAPRNNATISSWAWPARGRIVERYSATSTGNKGIDIAGQLGESVIASAEGVVVYSGNGVRGYDNLIILKHNESYLSAYAYNKELLVKVGDHVKAGQRIASMGRNNAGQARDHPLSPIILCCTHRHSNNFHYVLK
jgi:lipoprotein NlpD